MRRKTYYIISFCCFAILISAFTLGYYIKKLNYSKIERNNNLSQLNKQDKTYNGISRNLNEINVHQTNKDKYSQDNEINFQDELVKAINTQERREKTTENTKIIFTRKYLKCNHKEVEEFQISLDMIGLEQEEFEKVNPEWNIESFNAEKVVVYTEVNEKCSNHYTVKEHNGKIGVFYNNNGAEHLKDIIDTNIKQLRQEDAERLKKGIQVDSKQELAELMEDFTG